MRWTAMILLSDGSDPIVTVLPWPTAWIQRRESRAIPTWVIMSGSSVAEVNTRSPAEIDPPRQSTGLPSFANARL